MNLYLALDILIAALPAALSFHGKVRYFRKWPAASLAAVLVGIPFVAWDAVMTRSGAWSFNAGYAGNLRILSLPLGELFFFLAVPFSCLFIYEAVGAYSREKTTGGRFPWLAASAACAAGAVLLRGRLYTSTVLAATCAFLLLAAFLSRLLSSRRFWLAIGLSYAPFLLFNGILTALPVVSYGKMAIIGVRVGSIPVEDFLYSFCLLGFTILAYSHITHAASPHP